MYVERKFFGENKISLEPMPMRLVLLFPLRGPGTADTVITRYINTPLGYPPDCVWHHSTTSNWPAAPLTAK